MAAKGADTDAGVQSETHRKLLQSLERIEKRAGEGVWSREEFQAFRDGVIRRARNIVNGANGTGGTPAVVPAADTGALEPSLQAAVDVLEKHAAAGQATAVDFQAVRDQLAIRARSQARGASQAEQVAASETYVKLIQSLDRLEARAAQGGYSREEFAALRSSFVKRARNIDGASSPGSPAAANAGVNTSSTGAAPLAPPELTAIEKGLIDALDGLEKRVAAGGATREDWQRVRDQLSARARSAVAGLSPAEVQTQGETYRKLEQSLERLEKRASEGPYSREEFDVLRQAFTRRARNIVGDSAGSSNSQTGSDGSSVIKFDGATGRAERAPTARDKGAETPAPGPAGEPKTQRPQPAPVVEPKPERPLPAGETPKPERPAPIPPAPPAPSERPKPEPPERPPHSA